MLDAAAADAAAAAQRASLIRHTDAFESSNTGGEGAPARARRANVVFCWLLVVGWNHQR